MVVIKDMEMPKNCWGCKLFHYYFDTDSTIHYICKYGNIEMMGLCGDLKNKRSDFCPLMEENNKVYVLTADGWTQGYGSAIYLMGVFFDKETAEKKAEEQDVYVSITEIEVNKIFPLKINDFQERTNAYYLGGYIE